MQSGQPDWFIKIPPPIWMLAMLACAFVADAAIGSLPFEAQSLWLAGVLALAGIVLDIWAFAVFRSAGTELLPASASNKRLIMLGPYRFTRNPMYLGLILLSFAIALAIGRLFYFAVPALMALLCNGLFIPFEEAKMQRQFGNQYTDYLARVRRWL